MNAAKHMYQTVALLTLDAMLQTEKAPAPTSSAPAGPTKDKPPDGATRPADAEADLARITAGIADLDHDLSRGVTTWKVLLVVSFLAIIVGPIVVAADMFTAASVPTWVSALALAVTATRALTEACSPGAALAGRRTMRGSLGQLQCDVEAAAQAGTTLAQRNEFRRRLNDLQHMNPKDAIPRERTTAATSVEGLTQARRAGGNAPPA